MEDRFLYDNSVLLEITKLKKDKKRKHCRDCGEYGHYHKNQIKCPIREYEEVLLINKIKERILGTDCLVSESNDDILQKLSCELNISFNYCRGLYSKIPMGDLLHRTMDIKSYLSGLEKVECDVCNATLYSIYKNSIHTWKGGKVCDKCWYNYKGERDILWKKVRNYRKLECCVCKCDGEEDGVRINYDHLNMFEKRKSICTMVDEGEPIEEIYKEIDLCQIVCLTCHHIITDIENKKGFTRIKSSLTKQYNSGEITDTEYQEMKKRYEVIYQNVMLSIYQEISLIYN